MLKGMTLSRARSAGYFLLGTAVGSTLPFFFMPMLQFCVSVSDFRYIGRPLLLVLPLFCALSGAYLVSAEADDPKNLMHLIGLGMLIVGSFVLIMRTAMFFFLRDVTNMQFGTLTFSPDSLIRFITYLSVGAIVIGCVLLRSSRRSQHG